MEVLTLTTNAWRGALSRDNLDEAIRCLTLIVARQSAARCALPPVWRGSTGCLGGQSLSGIGTWSNDASAARGRPKPSFQSVTYLVKPEWPKIALIYAMTRLANDMWPAPGRVVTLDLRGARERVPGAAKSADGNPPAWSQALAAEAGLRAHDRHLIATFRSAQRHF